MDKLFLHHNPKYTCGYDGACQSRSSPNRGSQVNNTADPCISKWQLTVCGHCGLFWQIRWLVFLFHPLTCYLGMAQCAAFVCSTAVNACSYSNAYTRQLPDRWCWSGSCGLSFFKRLWRGFCACSKERRPCIWMTFREMSSDFFPGFCWNKSVIAVQQPHLTLIVPRGAHFAAQRSLMTADEKIPDDLSLKDTSCLF